MSARSNFLFALVLLLAMITYSCLYIVEEGQRGILERLGKIYTDDKGTPYVYEPGLHFKWPFINRARIFDVRLQTLNVEVGRRDLSSSGYQQNSRIVTKEKKDVIVDYFVKWKIVDLATFLTSTQGSSMHAEDLLTRLISDNLRAEFGKRTITDVVSGERTDIMKLMREKTAGQAEKLGIEMVDVRIKKIDLPKEVSEAVYQRMRTEREKKANEHRAKGKSEAEKIQAAADRHVVETLARASSESKIIRGQGDAEAASIYAETYGKDPDFYEFYRSLQAYRHAFKDKDDILILRPDDSRFFKYFSDAKHKS